MLWIPFTLLAAFMQAWRNAFQKQLSKEVSIAGVTLARFLWASPLAAIYLFSLYQWQPVAWPEFSLPFSGFIIAAALAQILATALMVKLFKLRNYAIGAGLAHQGAQFVFAGGRATRRADTRLVARPIAPVRLIEPELVDVHVVR